MLGVLEMLSPKLEDSRKWKITITMREKRILNLSIEDLIYWKYKVKLSMLIKEQIARIKDLIETMINICINAFII